jgi:tol-pal system protein YbgF
LIVSFSEGSTMKRFLLLVLMVALAALLTETPGAAADREHRQIMADIRMLQEQTQQLHLALGTLADALKIVTTKLDEQAALDRKGFADQKLLVDNVADGVRVLREKLDDSNVRLASLAQEVEALRMAIPPPAPTVQPAPAAGAAAGETPAGTPSPPSNPQSSAPAQPLQPGTTPQRMYDEAFGDYTAGRWALAVTGFESYISSFPRSELADDAQFYIGAALQFEGKYDEAVKAFDKVIVNYPGSNSGPQALYKRGACYESMRQLDRAQQSYEMVVKNFPDSDAAFLAKQALDRLKKPKG